MSVKPETKEDIRAFLDKLPASFVTITAKRAVLKAMVDEYIDRASANKSSAFQTMTDLTKIFERLRDEKKVDFDMLYSHARARVSQIFHNQNDRLCLRVAAALAATPKLSQTTEFELAVEGFVEPTVADTTKYQAMFGEEVLNMVGTEYVKYFDL